MAISSQFGEHIKQLREQQNMLQRQVASLLDIDTPLFSKIERGERTAKKDLVIKLSEVLKTDKQELITLWLVDQVLDVVKDEDAAEAVLRIVSKKISQRKNNF